jgi:hypothetical protein
MRRSLACVALMACGGAPVEAPPAPSMGAPGAATSGGAPAAVVSGPAGTLAVGEAAKLPEDFPLPEVAAWPGARVEMVVSSATSGMASLTLPRGAEGAWDAAVRPRLAGLGCDAPQQLDQPPKHVLNCQTPHPGTGFRGVVVAWTDAGEALSASVTWLREVPGAKPPTPPGPEPAAAPRQSPPR